jgi:hypothetical protein
LRFCASLPVLQFPNKKNAQRTVLPALGKECLNMVNRSKFRLTAKLQLPNSDTRVLRLVGRDAWALMELVRCGPRGCTPIDNPGPRWSAYIHNLRKVAFAIVTVTEPHGGSFAGTHARYVLKSSVTLENVVTPAGEASNAKTSED